MYNRIITHNDFDGIICAALCANHFNLNSVLFAGPNSITDKTVSIKDTDIVCDLPYPSGCGLWFDHHIGNKEELSQRNINIDNIKGKFDVKPSCARVIFDHLNNISPLPDYFGEAVAEADTIDAFSYASAQDWQNKTPGKIINSAISLKSQSFGEENDFLRKIVFELRDYPISKVSKLEWITSRSEKYFAEEESMIKTITGATYFIPHDKNKEIAVIDLTIYNKKPNIVKTLVFLTYPQAKSVIVIQNQFNNGVKLNNMFISMSLGFYFHNKNHGKDIGFIMDELGLGDGHKGAAGGRIRCESKQDMIKKKDRTLSQIFSLWQSQPEELPQE